jgi:uncharacterized protein
MIAVDTNILLYAHREEMPTHVLAKQRLVQLAEGDAPWGLPVFCLGEFVRVATHPRVFTPQSSLEQALGFLDGLIASPTVRLLVPDESYWSLFGKVTRGARAAGNLAFDAQIATLCVLYGSTLLTADRDFARFPIKTEGLDDHPGR